MVACFIWMKGFIRLIVVSTIDNMVKGTAGQAIQNMNLMFGLKENTGLNYVGPSF